MTPLKSQLIKLAWAYPETRSALIPLLKESYTKYRSPTDPRYVPPKPIPEVRDHKQLLFSDETFLYAKTGDRVKVHLNLGVKFKKYGMKTWSIKDMSGSKTIGHVYSVVLRDVKFIVRGSGNAQVRGGGEKTVHAFCEGILVSADLKGTGGGFSGQEVRYNPHQQMKQFCVEDPNAEPCEDCGFHTSYTRPVYVASKVFLSPKWKVLAKDAV